MDMGMAGSLILYVILPTIIYIAIGLYILYVGGPRGLGERPRVWAPGASVRASYKRFIDFLILTHLLGIANKPPK